MGRLAMLSVVLLGLLGCGREDASKPQGGMDPSTMDLTIHEAARAGDLEAVRRLLDLGSSIDAVEDETGHSTLMAACAASNPSAAVVELLLERGADVNALPAPSADDAHPMPALALAVRHAPLSLIERLIAAGADTGFRSKHGYTLLTLAATSRRVDVIRALREAGAPLDGESPWGESVLSVLSRQAEFTTINELLAAGADPAPLKWTGLHRAIVLGNLEAVRASLAEGSDLEARDGWERTAFLLAVHVGDEEKASLLLTHGADRSATGRCQKPVVSYAVDNDDVEMLRWLVKEGFDLDARDEFDSTPLMDAAEHGAVACFRLLLEAGANTEGTDHVGDSLIEKASHPEIVAILIQRGDDPGRLSTSVLRDYIGLGTIERLDVSETEYRAGRVRVFGSKNPERMAKPFWEAMVKCGWAAYTADEQFGGRRDGADPTWCHARYGMSLTPLPDGRFVQIAGEHEDSYDPDFCIYNDVIVHDGKGGFTIYGYPKAVFPPTDFHTATLVGEWIYVIGNLGYAGESGTHTQVFRLNTTSFEIERVQTTGEDPGWISRHSAALDGGRVVVTGGKVVSPSDGDYVDQVGQFEFDLSTHGWSRMGASER